MNHSSSNPTTTLAGFGATPWCRLGLALVLGVSPAPIQGQVVLNELLAINRTAVEFESDHPDYLELYNASDAAVALAGYSLTDDPAQRRLFVFPAGTSIPARGRLVVWCDDEVQRPGLHTGFGLGASGDLVQFYAPNGITLLDQISFGLQIPDGAIARVPEGSAQWSLATPSPGGPNQAMSLGTGQALRLNEWMARPVAGEDWIEVFNGENLPVPLSGSVLTDTATGVPDNRPIPNLSFIAPLGFVQFFASDLASDDADHLDFRLSSSAETLTLYAANRTTVLDRIVYGAQTDDVSQGRSPDGSDRIRFFQGVQVTPGAANFVELTSVVISEVLTHTDPPYEDAIELHNTSASPVDISHWWLSDSAANPKKLRIPSGTVLAAGGYVVFYEFLFGAGANGFQLNSYLGEEVYLSAGDASGNLTGPQSVAVCGALKNGVAVGRHPTSTGIDWAPLSRPTFGVSNPATLTQFRQGRGAANAAARVGPVALTEIMFDPAATPGANEEYLELSNITALPVPLHDPLFPTNTWRVRGAVSFNVPTGLILPAGGSLLLVGFDPDLEPARLQAFRTHYSIPPSVTLLGPWDGALSNSGELVELLWPDKPEPPGSPVPGFVPYERLEFVQYQIASPWPTGAMGTGLSLQRVPLDAYGNDPVHWVTGPPSPGGGVDPEADSDQDGLPDAWELMFGFDPSQDVEAEVDHDGDGATALEEFLAGTHPHDPESVLRIVGVTAGNGSVQLDFASVSNRGYRVESSPLHPPGPWVTATNLEPASSSGIRSVLLPASSNNAAYRLVVP